MNAVSPLPPNPIEATDTAGTRKVPEINPVACRVNWSGGCWKQVVAYGPAGLIADDLKEPGIWRQVQLSPHVRLRANDELVIFGPDLTWRARATVDEAGPDRVAITVESVKPRTSRLGNFPGDEQYRGAFEDGGWCLIRRKDNLRVRGPVANTELLWRELRQMYPTSVQ